MTNDTIQLATLLVALVTAFTGIAGIKFQKKSLWIATSVTLVLAITLACISFFPKNTEIKVIHSIKKPIVVYNSEMRIIDCNSQLEEFYQRSKKDLMGKSPSYLNSILKQRISNYSEWSAEQIERIASGEAGTLSSTTQIPMIFIKNKPFGHQNWHITSKSIKIDSEFCYITVFTPEGGLLK